MPDVSWDYYVIKNNFVYAKFTVKNITTFLSSESVLKRVLLWKWDKGFTEGTTADNLLRDKVFDEAENPSTDGYQRECTSLFY